MSLSGKDQLGRLFGKAVSAPIEEPYLTVGSDVEIATHLVDSLKQEFGQVVHTEGAFWAFGRTDWEKFTAQDLRLRIHRYDGKTYAANGGRLARIKLNKTRIDSILNEAATVCDAPGFFDSTELGINCASGFIKFYPDGTAVLWPHKPEHRQRHTLPGRWTPGTSAAPPIGSLLHRLLSGVFQSDEDATEKEAFVAEVCASAALGYACRLPEPRAVILYGATAGNGKSQILDLARGLLPASAVCSIPAGKLEDEKHVIGLAGKLLNAADELNVEAMAADKFKIIVTGDPIDGREVYKSRAEFRPVAQHIFATNHLPSFRGGIDRGVQRRVAIIPFNRSIPPERRIPGIGRKIAETECDILLAWVVGAASRLILNNGFSIPLSCKQAQNDWMHNVDPTLGWLEARTRARTKDDVDEPLRTSIAYDDFKLWATGEGFRLNYLPSVSGFVPRIRANAPWADWRKATANPCFHGLLLK